MRKCEIDGCTNSHRAKGLCIVHYNHLVRYGSGAGKFETKFRELERERIIKLLEEHPCFSLETCQQGCLAHDLLVANIALIKGENK